VTLSSIIATNAARETEQVAFTLVSVISCNIARGACPVMVISSPQFKKSSSISKICTDIPENWWCDSLDTAAGEIEQLTFILFSGISRTLSGYFHHCGNFSPSS